MLKLRRKAKWKGEPPSISPVNVVLLFPGGPYYVRFEWRTEWDDFKNIKLANQAYRHPVKLMGQDGLPVWISPAGIVGYRFNRG